MPRNLPRTLERCSLVLSLSCAAVASAGTSIDVNPEVTFGTPGTKQVSLQVCAAGACRTVTKTVTVLDPMPAVTSLVVTPTPVPQGGVVRFSAAGSGQPPLTYRWRVVDAAATTVATLVGVTVDWTAIDPPGVYSVFLDLSNGSGLVTSPASVVTVSASPFIFGDGFELGAARWLKSP